LQGACHCGCGDRICQDWKSYNALKLFCVFTQGKTQNPIQRYFVGEGVAIFSLELELPVTFTTGAFEPQEVRSNATHAPAISIATFLLITRLRSQT
jgi:hypothetical protein